jgi:ABC-type Na+ transport system ATPase subunit NatA
MQSDTIIRVANLSKVFRVLKRKPGFMGGLRTLFSTDYEEVRAVHDISFTIAPGELVGYIGPNGAGKSTTIKILTGILYPSSGDVAVAGLAPHRERTRNGKQIGVIFGQRSQLLWDIPPRDSFDLMRRMYAIPPDRYRTNLQLFTDLLDLGELLDRPVRLLSLGQRMRCDLVASLLHDPKVVYLDEPTIGLDVVAKDRIREFIQHLNQQRGRLDYLMVRPAGVLFQIAGESGLNPSARGRAVIGIAVIIIAARGQSVAVAWWWALYLPAVVISGVLLLFSLYLLMACLSFWFTTVNSLLTTVAWTAQFGRFPITIFGPALQFVFTWVFPFALIGFYPVAFLLRGDAYRLYGLLALVVGWVFLGLALALWHIAIRHYQSTGS